MDTLRGERDRYLGLLKSLVDLIDRLDSNFAAVIAQAKDSRLSLCRGVDPLLDECRALHEEDDFSEDDPAPSSTK